MLVFVALLNETLQLANGNATNKKEQITVACYESWNFQRSVFIRGG